MGKVTSFNYRARSLFRLDLLLAQRASTPEDAIELAQDVNELRRKIQLLCQETRFSIYLYLREKTEPQSRKSIADGLKIGTEKIYHHLYVLLKENILLNLNPAGEEPLYDLNERFTASILEVFSHAQDVEKSSKKT